MLPGCVHSCPDTGTRRTALSAFALSLSCALSASTARADAPRIEVVAEGCGDLDTNEVALVLELELEEQAGSWEELTPPPVRLACESDAIGIAVSDPITSKRLERAIPRPRAEGLERSIALAISQLFLTSWLELLLPAERRGPMPALPAAPAERAERAARDAVPTTPPPVERELAGHLGVHGGARVRDLGEPYASPFVAARAGIELDPWSLFVHAGFERGSSSRSRGTVTTSIGDFGVGAGFRASLTERLSLETRVVVSALYVRLTGESTSPMVRAGRSDSAAAQVALELGPSLSLPPLRGGLSIVAGVTLFAPEGVVSQEAPVRPGGIYLGGQIDLATIL